MTYTVVLEQTTQGYTAVVPALPGCRADGPTRTQALANVRREIGNHLRQVEIATVTVEAGDGSLWTKDAGTLADHPCWHDFCEGVALARAEAEEAERQVA